MIYLFKIVKKRESTSFRNFFCNHERNVADIYRNIFAV